MRLWSGARHLDEQVSQSLTVVQHRQRGSIRPGSASMQVVALPLLIFIHHP
jgi:hypothetical protein